MSEFWRIFLLLTAGGTIGGLLYWTSIYLSSGNAAAINQSATWRPTALFCAANAFMGIGGAWAALLAMFWARRAPLGSSTPELLQLIAVFIVAGYAGNRILPAVAAGVTQQLLASATETALTAARSANRSRVITEAIAYLSPGAVPTEHQTASVIASLQSELHRSPASKDVALLLARTFAERRDDNQGAIAALQSFIAARRAVHRNDDEEIAAASWELASYFEAAFAKTGDTKLRENAIAALAECLRIEPAYRSSLANAPALKGLLDDTAAKSLLQP
jgi:hypothetical protein